MKKVLIERKKSPLTDDFAREYLSGEGKPVILTDAIKNWSAPSVWTFEHLKSSYGSDLVAVSLGGVNPVAWKLTKFSSFIDHLDTPSGDLPGFWLDREGKPLGGEPERGELRYYLMGWNALRRHPELCKDISPAPGFTTDWTLALDANARELVEWICDKELTSVYIGPADTISRLHRDFGHTHAYLAQIRGVKEAILFSPSDSGFVYNGQVDPEQPDPELFPLLDQATAYAGVIEPGDLLFIPPGWWHCVRSLEKSITISHNFFNDANFSRHLSYLFKKAPRLLKGFDQHPEWREALGNEWDPKRFGASDS